MRKIKFRGKDTGTGEWVQGYFAGITNNEAAIIPFDKVDYDVGYIGDSECSYCNIETVGQSTGLLDKNGKEIYEGDIIFSQKYNQAVLHEIEYNVDNAKFVAKIQGLDFDFCEISQDWIDNYGKEIIGNIYDNPEILKAETL